MSRPNDHDIARAIGVRPEMVPVLRKRGLPCARLDEARQWFAHHGMAYHDSGKPHGARGFRTAGAGRR